MIDARTSSVQILAVLVRSQELLEASLLCKPDVDPVWVLVPQSFEALHAWNDADRVGGAAPRVWTRQLAKRFLLLWAMGLTNRSIVMIVGEENKSISPGVLAKMAAGALRFVRRLKSVALLRHYLRKVAGDASVESPVRFRSDYRTYSFVTVSPTRHRIRVR